MSDNEINTLPADGIDERVRKALVVTHAKLQKLRKAVFPIVYLSCDEINGRHIDDLEKAYKETKP